MSRGTWPFSSAVKIALAGLLVTAGARAAAGGDPVRVKRSTNVVLMLIDNVGYGDLGCYGNKSIKTPEIDRLARQGVRCTDFYIGSPSCMPSRGALLTGRHPVRNGLNVQLWKTPSTEQIGLPHRELLLPQLLRPQGYRTACFGKWNIGFARGSRPTERGFDEFFGHASGNMDYYTHIYAGQNDLYRGTEQIEAEGYSTDLFAEAACEFIRRNARRPFFAYVPFNAAHYPNPRSKRPGQPCIWQAPAEHFRSYGYSPDEQDPRKRYRAVITALDAGIGRVVRQIDTLGLSERTLVILLSDNGAFMLPNRGLEVASNLPLRDGGVTLYEGGIRVPCIVRWPPRIKPATVCRRPLVSMDLFVMILRAAGAELPGDRVIDGRDPTAALAGEVGSPHDHLFFRWGSRSAVRRGRHKLLRNEEDEPWKLYDLVDDLAETKDLAAEKPEVVAGLARRFERWAAEVRR
ncbi:MAG: sulfatase-like hydrolase/transferase [Planctomycetota bacterium]|jgi:arylsulfatase A-like enzyme